MEDKNCLVTRSKCWLQLGNAENALADSETALLQDKDFIRVNINVQFFFTSNCL
jgi:hypothetical protein